MNDKDNMKQSSKISEEQWQAWLLDPVTQWLRDWARQERYERRDMWEGAHFESPVAHEVCMRNSAAIGACSVFRTIEGLNYQDMMGVEDVSTKTVGYGSTAGDEY